MGRRAVIVLDTHALVWMDQDDAALGRTARQVIQAAWENDRVAVSAITFWECQMLQQAGRLSLTLPVAEWRADWLAAGLLELPIDGETALLSVRLDLPHKDPTDRFITATAMQKQAELVTADRRLLDWSSSLPRHDAAR